MNRQGRGPDYAQCGIGQRLDAFGVHIVTQHAVQEPVNAVEAEGVVRFHCSLRVSGYAWVESETNGFRQPLQGKRKIRNRRSVLWILFGIR